MKLWGNYSYLKSDRLADIVRLISVLSLDKKWSFRKTDGIEGTLNGKPKSAKEWFDIAREHPEFFKFNSGNTTIVLLMRFLNTEVVNGVDTYPPLTIDQTQALIDQAITLHDKQISRFQKNSFLVPILTALIAAIATGLVSYITLKGSNASIKQVENKVDSMIEVLNKQHMNALQKSSAPRRLVPDDRLYVPVRGSSPTK